MKILHLNTYDISGGAARAAYRIHKGLQGVGINSKMLVQAKLSDDKTVIAPETKVKKRLLELYRANKNFWNLVTGSSYHAPNPQIFSYEIKVVSQR